MTPRRPPAHRFSTFQRLALWTTAVTYLLILVGGLVRASGAGLGCPDWPRCFGSWVPPLSAADLPPAFDRAQFNPVLMWTEYLNRLLGVTVGFLIFATLISAWRDQRRTPGIVWSSLAAFLLVGFQGWLGGVVVQHELAAWIVTAHLIVALVIVSLLLYATVYAFFADRGLAGPGTVPAGRGQLQWSMLALLVITLAQVALGAQVRGGIDDAVIHGTARALALGTVGGVDSWHRELALVVIGGAVIVLLQIRGRYQSDRALVLASFVMVALAAAQIALGVGMAYVALTPAAQVGHLTVASLLLGAETVVFLLARWLP